MSFFKKIFSSENQKRDKSQLLAESRSPSCPITATVEQDNKVAYFYLWGDEGLDFGVKACWIRNLDDAPIEINVKEIKKGIPPMLNKEFCKFANGQKSLEINDLEIVWLEEGDGAALLERNEIIAIIPSWGSIGGFPGYARDCKGQGEYCWELTSWNILEERVKKSKEYWNLWDEEITPFQIIQPQLLKIYENTLGSSEKYFAIDGKEWPPKGLFLKNGDLRDVFVTVGVSILPMPTVEMYSENPEEINRIELGIILNSGLTQSELDNVVNWISGQAGIPWNRISWLGNGHTITFNLFVNSKITSVILVKDLDVVPHLEIEDYRGSNVNILWMIPITENERNYVINNGSELFLKRLNSIGPEVFNINRNEIILNE
jgi:hypothetical protein